MTSFQITIMAFLYFNHPTCLSFFFPFDLPIQHSIFSFLIFTFWGVIQFLIDLKIITTKKLKLLDFNSNASFNLQI